MAPRAVTARTRAACRCFTAGSCPIPPRVAALKARKVLAFAGIGDPEKFFATARAAGHRASRAPSLSRSSPLHAPRKRPTLIMQAEHDGLALLTTEKDRARMTGDPALAALAARAHVLPVTLEIDGGGRVARRLRAQAVQG